MARLLGWMRSRKVGIIDMVGFGMDRDRSLANEQALPTDGGFVSASVGGWTRRRARSTEHRRQGRAGQGKARLVEAASRASKAEGEKLSELKVQAPFQDRRCVACHCYGCNQVWLWEEVKVQCQSSEEGSPKCS